MVPITTTISLATTVAQTSTPLIFGMMPPIIRVIATVIDTGTHYSTVITTTRGHEDERDMHVTDDDSFDSEQDHDTPPRRRRDNDHSRGNRHRSRQNNNESRGPTNQDYEERIRAFEEEIAQMKRDIW